MTISEIMEQYKSGEITMKEANIALAHVEAGFYLKEYTPEELEEKRRRELEEGTISPEELAKYR